MDWKLVGTVFATVFVAELGDKTQLATFLYAARAENAKWGVFLGAAAALVLASALGVAAGSVIAAHVSPRVLTWAAGIGFIAVGVWTLIRGA